MPFNQQVTFPCELTLRSTPNGPRLLRQPIREIALLHTNQVSWTNRTLQSDQTLSLESTGSLFHIRSELAIPDGAKLAFNIRGVPLVFTSTNLQSGGKPVALPHPVRDLEILVDRASIETFVNQGEVSFTRFVLPAAEGLSLQAMGGPVSIQSVTVHQLKSAWTKGLFSTGSSRRD